MVIQSSLSQQRKNRIMSPIVLGIESTAHTFGVGIATDKGEILANVNDIYIPETGGIKPREAAEHHSKVASKVILRALEEADIRDPSNIDAFAIALGPGMGPCLRIGATLARYLALKFNKPLVPVNHAIAHIEIARLSTRLKDPVVVYVSGGNTLITTFVEGRYRIFGETLDISLGNCLDTFARKIGLDMPGVPKIEKIAMKGKNYVKMPYIVKGQDLSYSGLLTYALRLYEEGEYSLEDICYSLIETSYSMIVEIAERALAHLGKNELTLTGGVAKSMVLSNKLEIMARNRNAIFRPVEKKYAGDNGAMIAYTGALAFSYGITLDVSKSYIKPLWRLDEVDIPWRK